METKISTHTQIRSSFSGGKSVSVRSVRKTVNTNFAETAKKTNSDTFSMSSQPVESSLSKEKSDELKLFSSMIKQAQSSGGDKVLKKIDIAEDDYKGQTKFNFELINSYEKSMNDGISKRLEEVGVPKDVTFEFDYNFDSMEIKIKGISDEEYRESVKSVLNGSKYSFRVISCASRVMNGYISSLYYPWISKALDRCFEQDISELYIDENGNLGGVNENLQEALDAAKKAENNGEHFNANHDFGFPANNIEGIVKRLVSDKNITLNISHMGYDGKQIYTDDGEFKFGKDFDPNLFGEERYLMRGTVSLYITVCAQYNRWLNNEEKFN